MGEVKSPYDLPECTNPLSYRTIWGICSKCHKMFKFAYRGKLPVWEQIHCPFCGEMITPIAIEKEILSTEENFNPNFNPSRRNRIE